MKLVVIVLVVMFLGSATALIAMLASRDRSSDLPPTQSVTASPALAPDPVVEGMKILTFELVDQGGEVIDNSVFDGKVTITSFFFTHCPFICPRLIGTQSILYEELARSGVGFLSISVDPSHDTVEQLAAHADKFDAKRPAWRFATAPDEETGPGATSWRMLEEGLWFHIAADAETPIELTSGGGSMANIQHPEHLVLVGPVGEVLGVYRSSDDAEIEKLRERAEVAAEALKRGA